MTVSFMLYKRKYSQEIKKPNCDFGKTYNILKNIDMLRGQLSKE